MAKNIDVIRAFIDGDGYSSSSSTKNLRYVAHIRELVNYNTTLARYDHGNHGWYIMVNRKKYSRTTSKIQTQLMEELKNKNIELVDMHTGEIITQKQ